MQEKLLKLVGSFISSVIEGITQEVTERIDTIDNESVREIATDIVVDYDYSDIVTDHATDVVDNYDFSSIVEDGIGDYDFSDIIGENVEGILQTTDFSTYVESALDDYDFDYKVKCALEELDVSADCDSFDSRLKALEERQVKIMDALITIGKSVNSVTNHD
ncbi:MAG: hypothetical protein Unbinned4294contig1001_4 [Prokaryotic dsDNA virus sp.]|jgi:hypothetical protein|nr:MAG: hypothetical protein Unbinned4294contig1001_4 [Prokaryotic dsDNA virus sp.]|tara:strand:+ start:1268 stop:1753 length:486 start_codon:yes stop_codon:yes gene_type:complete